VSELIEAVERLKGDIRSIGFIYPTLEKESQDAVERARVEWCKTNKLKGKAAIDSFQKLFYSIPEQIVFSSYVDELASELEGAIAIGEKHDFNMINCRKMAESLRSPFDAPEPYTFSFDARVEVDFLISLLSRKRSRKQPDSDVTEWVRKNWHKYGYTKTKAVHGFIENNEKSPRLFKRLYDQLNNDCRKIPLERPKKSK
jgi:hypothetical protein